MYDDFYEKDQKYIQFLNKISSENLDKSIEKELLLLLASVERYSKSLVNQIQVSIYRFNLMKYVCVEVEKYPNFSTLSRIDKLIIGQLFNENFKTRNMVMFGYMETISFLTTKKQQNNEKLLNCEYILKICNEVFEKLDRNFKNILDRAISSNAKTVSENIQILLELCVTKNANERIYMKERKNEIKNLVESLGVFDEDDEDDDEENDKW